MKMTLLAPVLCPYCAVALDAATKLDGDGAPCAGDFSVCLRCAGLLVFDVDLRPTKPGLGYYEAACAEQPDLAAAITAARRAVLLANVARPWPTEEPRH